MYKVQINSLALWLFVYVLDEKFNTYKELLKDIVALDLSHETEINS